MKVYYSNTSRVYYLINGDKYSFWSEWDKAWILSASRTSALFYTRQLRLIGNNFRLK